MAKKNAQSVDDQIVAALYLTAGQLQFTAGKCEVEPDKLYYTRTANCIGYASFCAGVLNELFTLGDMDNWQAVSLASQLHFFDLNIHDFLSHPFLKDHDIVIVRNNATGETRAIDPSLFDYTGIRYITIH